MALPTHLDAWRLCGFGRSHSPRDGPTTAIHVLIDRNCGCCGAWVEVLQSEGFDVAVQASMGSQLARYKLDHGIPQAMVSCHTGRIEGYTIEGHVPVADIRRLLDERLDAVGLAVPGMPCGSPGMGRKTNAMPMTCSSSGATARLKSMPAILLPDTGDCSSVSNQGTTSGAYNPPPLRSPRGSLSPRSLATPQPCTELAAHRVDPSGSAIAEPFKL